MSSSNPLGRWRIQELGSMIGRLNNKLMSASPSELRLVVLGNTSAVCTILGLEDKDQGEDGEQQGSKYRGEAAGRKVLVVSSPAWFRSSCSPDDRRRHICSLVASSSPGPHAFLLCVPLNRPADGEDKALDALKKLFGPSAVSANTIILFTHTDELEEDEKLEQYLVTWRKDLLRLVEECGGRYHTLETWHGEAEEREAVEELLKKVDRAVEESGTPHVSCPLYEQAEEKLRERQAEIVRKKRREEEEPGKQEPAAGSEDDITEEEMEAVREEAEGSVADLDLDVEEVFPSARVVSSSSLAALSLLHRLWEKLTAWIRWLPTLVRREALLGALVGMFVGGPVGGMVGATVGSVATEVKRRKTQKTK